MWKTIGGKKKKKRQRYHLARPINPQTFPNPSTFIHSTHVDLPLFVNRIGVHEPLLIHVHFIKPRSSWHRPCLFCGWPWSRTPSLSFTLSSACARAWIAACIVACKITGIRSSCACRRRITIERVRNRKRERERGVRKREKKSARKWNVAWCGRRGCVSRDRGVRSR